PLPRAVPAGWLRVRRHLRADRRPCPTAGGRPAPDTAITRQPARPVKLPVRQPVARGSMRRSRRGADLLARLLGLALMVAAAAGIYWFVSADRFRLDPAQVRIAGLVYTNEQQLRAAIGLDGTSNPNVFRLKPAQMAETLRGLPSVASAQVEVTLPD